MEKQFIAFMENYYEQAELPENMNWQALASWIMARIHKVYPDVNCPDEVNNESRFYGFLRSIGPALYERERRRIGRRFSYDMLSIVGTVLDRADEME